MLIMMPMMTKDDVDGCDDDDNGVTHDVAFTVALMPIVIMPMRITIESIAAHSLTQRR